MSLKLVFLFFLIVFFEESNHLQCLFVLGRGGGINIRYGSSCQQFFAVRMQASVEYKTQPPILHSPPTQLPEIFSTLN